MSNKTDLVNAVAADTGTSIAQAKRSVESVLVNIRSLAEDGLQLREYGKFSMRNKAAREVQHPHRPSEKVKVPARRVMGFKSSKALD